MKGKLFDVAVYPAAKVTPFKSVRLCQAHFIVLKAYHTRHENSDHVHALKQVAKIDTDRIVFDDKHCRQCTRNVRR